MLKPESEWILVPCPAIVPEELWEECNAILMRRKASKKPVTKRAVYAFAGFVYCACGEKMYVRSNTPKYVCMACRTKIPIVDLDHIFQGQLEDFTLSPEAIEAYLAQGSEAVTEKEELLDALFRERERLTKEAEKLYRLYQEDGLTVQGFRERHRPLEERLTGLGTEIPRLQGEIDFLMIRTTMEGEIVGRTRDLAEEWPQMETALKRTVVETLVERITVGKDTVEIDLIALPPLREMMANGPSSGSAACARRRSGSPAASRAPPRRRCRSSPRRRAAYRGSTGRGR